MSSSPNQGIFLEDSLATGRRMAQLPEPSPTQSQTVRNLSTVLFSPQAEITSRRTAYANLQRSAEPEAKKVLDRFHASGLSLEERITAPASALSSAQKAISK